MKKLIFILFIPLVLSACSVKSYTPIIETSFCYDAKYIMGDFCFNSNIKKDEDLITIEVKDTRAKGLVITCDSNNITFKKGEFSRSFDRNSLNKTNPSLVIDCIFDYIESNTQTNVKKTEDGFVYTGNTPIGNFEAYQDFNNKFYLILIPNANIRIELTPVSV